MWDDSSEIFFRSFLQEVIMSSSGAGKDILTKHRSTVAKKQTEES